MKVALKRGVCLMLPVCLVWLFAACVAICSSHVEETNFVVEDAAHFNLVSSEEDDCCSISSAQGLLPERAGFSITPVNAAIDAATNFSNHTGNNYSHFRDWFLFSSSSPPPKFSGTLRI